MQDYSDYRETPRTGRAPGQSLHELDPKAVDPAVLTDDRDNPDLLTFEKTWGHRMLAGISIAMLVIALVLAILCITQLVRLADVASVLPNAGMWGMALWGVMLMCALALVLPAATGIFVAKNPKYVPIAIGMAIFALILVVIFLIYAIASAPRFVFAAVLYSLLFALLPVLYLIAALKIKRSN